MPGDLVSYKTSTGNVLRCGSGWYDKAVVLSVDPFELVSEAGDMRWTSTIKIDDFEKVGEASTAVLVNVIGRIRRDDEQRKDLRTKMTEVFEG